MTLGKCTLKLLIRTNILELAGFRVYFDMWKPSRRRDVKVGHATRCASDEPPLEGGYNLITKLWYGSFEEGVEMNRTHDDTSWMTSVRRLSSMIMGRVGPLCGRARTTALLVGLLAAGPVMAVEYRTIDGTNNNQNLAILGSDLWGSAGIPLLRGNGDTIVVPADYDDGISTPAGASRPSPREISNTVAAQSASVLSEQKLSDMVWQWGQFVDHDIDLTLTGSESFNIAVPGDDLSFVPGSEIPLSRSVFDPATGTDASNPRQQTNSITAYIDGSNVYGSDDTRADWLRTGTDGLLKVTSHATGDLMPTRGGDPLAPGMAMDAVMGVDTFVAGDVRANEQAGLTAMHTLFVREHNRLAELIDMTHLDLPIDPTARDQEIYQRARQIVGAEIQAITYNEFLPALLGPTALTAYSGYDDTVDASITNEFSTAAYRLGHSMLSPDLLRLDDAGMMIPQGHLPLLNAFFNPAAITDTGIDPLLRGLGKQQMQEIDNLVIDGVRNFLFGPPGAGGLDLASLNIQRGRDHGLADYNTVRAAYGLIPVMTFSDITTDPSLAAALENLYGNVDNIDLWVASLAEEHLPGSSVGELFTAIIADQFNRLRDGDRFWYQRDIGDQLLLTQIENTTLADIILRNTDINHIQDNVFLYHDGPGQSVPEPMTSVLAVLGTATLGFVSRRRFV